MKKKLILFLLSALLSNLFFTISAFAFISNFSGPLSQEATSTFTEYVDVDVYEGGQAVRDISGDMLGQLTRTAIRNIHIQTGSYAGWSLIHSAYSFDAGYSGEVFLILDRNNQKSWGQARGDINAKIITEDTSIPDTKWFITSIYGQRTSQIINLGPATPTIQGTSTYQTNLEVNISENGAINTTSSGFYNGIFNRIHTRIFLPFFEAGFFIGTYSSSLGAGNFYNYLDTSAYPNNIQYGMLNGPLSGITVTNVIAPVSLGTIFSGTIEHLTNIPSSTPSGTMITDFSGPITQFATNSWTELVDVSVIENFEATRDVTGDFIGRYDYRVSRNISINAGTYANYSIVFGSYSFDSGYTGEIFVIVDRNNSKAWGQARGDINAKIITEDTSIPDTKWFITSIYGQQTSQIINLGPATPLAPGTTTSYPNVDLFIGENIEQNSNATGYYNGVYNRSHTRVFLSLFETGFLIGTYNSSLATGDLYSIIDRSGYPNVTQYGLLNGPLSGITLTNYTAPVSIGTVFSGTIEHIIAPSSTSVPIHHGLWLIPSMLTGIYLLRRRKK